MLTPNSLLRIKKITGRKRLLGQKNIAWGHPCVYVFFICEKPRERDPINLYPKSMKL